MVYGKLFHLHFRTSIHLSSISQPFAKYNKYCNNFTKIFLQKRSNGVTNRRPKTESVLHSLQYTQFIFENAYCPKTKAGEEGGRILPLSRICTPCVHRTKSGKTAKNAQRFAKDLLKVKDYIKEERARTKERNICMHSFYR